MSDSHSASSFLEEFCPNLMRCQKSICLYPHEHPRVNASLENLGQIVRQQTQQTGKPVTMNTIWRIQEFAS